MSNSKSQNNWMTWYPQEIFLKNISNKNTILFHFKKMNKQDFCTDIKKQDLSYNEHELQIKLDTIAQKKYKEGFKKGILESQLKCNELQEQLNNLCVSFEKNLINYQNTLHSELLKIVLKISSYVIGQKIDIDKSILLNYIKKIINENGIFLKKPRLIVHPDNQELIENTFKKFLNDYKWILEYDKSIDLHGCRIISEDGCLDNTIKARWEELYRLIFSEEY